MTPALDQPALLPGAVPARVLVFDEEEGILTLAPGEAHICPHCRDTEHQSWECGESDQYEMLCKACGQDYGVSITEALA